MGERERERERERKREKERETLSGQCDLFLHFRLAVVTEYTGTEDTGRKREGKCIARVRMFLSKRKKQKWNKKDSEKNAESINYNNNSR